MHNFDRDDVKKFIEFAAGAVASAARTAPHTTGKLDLVINVLSQDEITKIQNTRLLPGADPRSVLIYDGMLTIGAIITKSELAWDCGSCGFATCAQMNKAAKPKKKGGPRPPGPSCNWKSLDWSISLDYAAAMAANIGLQTRVQDIQGAIALNLGFAGDVDVCTTVPLMAETSNPFFGGRYDRATKAMIKEKNEMVELSVRRMFPTIMDVSMMDVMMSGYGMKMTPLLTKLIEDDPEDDK